MQDHLSSVILVLGSSSSSDTVSGLLEDLQGRLNNDLHSRVNNHHQRWASDNIPDSFLGALSGLGTRVQGEDEKSLKGLQGRGVVPGRLILSNQEKFQASDQRTQRGGSRRRLKGQDGCDDAQSGGILGSKDTDGDAVKRARREEVREKDHGLGHG